MLELPFEPTAAEQHFIESIGRGEEALPPPESMLLGDLDPRREHGWSGRTLRAELLALLVTAPDAAAGHVIEVLGWCISGHLDLTRARLQRSLRMTRCRVLGSLSMRGATTPELGLFGCVVLGRFEAPALTVGGSLALLRSEFAAGVQIDDAHVGENLDCRSASFQGGLSAQGIEVKGDAMLDRIETTGGVSLAHARISRDLLFTGASLSTDKHDALNVVGARLGGDLDCRGTHLVTRDREGMALDASGLTAQHAYLTVLAYRDGRHRRFETDGAVLLHGVELASLSCAGASIRHRGEIAFMLNSARIAGDVQLTATEVPGAQRSERFEVAGGVQIADSQLAADLRLDGARLAHPGGIALYAPALQARAVLLLPGPLGSTEPYERFEAAGAVRLEGCEIDSLNCAGARLRDGDGAAIVLTDARVAGSVQLGVDVRAANPAQMRFDAVGTVALSRTRVSGDVDLDGARVDGQIAATGLRAGAVRMGALVHGRMVVPFEAHGTVRLAYAEIGSLSCCGAVLDGASEASLSLRGAVVRSTVQLNSLVHEKALHRFQARGPIHVDDARIAGDLELMGARLHHGADKRCALRGEALHARRVRLSPLLEDGVVKQRFEATGEIDLRRAELDGLSAAGARLEASGRDADALIARGARFARGAWLGLVWAREGVPAHDEHGRPVRLEAIGTIDLMRSTMGYLDLRGARLDCEGGLALDLTSVTVGNAIHLGAACAKTDKPVLDGRLPVRFDAHGIVSLAHASAESLECGGARIAGTAQRALDARGLTTRSDVVLGRPRPAGGSIVRDPDGRAVELEVRGPTSLHGARISGRLDCRGAHFEAIDTSAGEPSAFNASNARVDGALLWYHVRCKGRVDLRQTSVGGLYDDADSWLTDDCGPLRLDAFDYRAMGSTEESARSGPEWRWRRAWLRRQARFASQPYQHLASAYRAAGDEQAARKIAMARFNVRLTLPQLRARPLETLWRTLLRAVIGHGYAPWRALLALAVLWGLGWMAVSAAVDAHAVIPRAPRAPLAARVDPTDCDQRRYPCLEPALLAADLLVPVVSLGQRDAWVISGARRFRLIPIALTAMGWILTTLVVAGFTGIVRRE